MTDYTAVVLARGQRFMVLFVSTAMSSLGDLVKEEMGHDMASLALACCVVITCDTRARSWP